MALERVKTMVVAQYEAIPEANEHTPRVPWLCTLEILNRAVLEGIYEISRLADDLEFEHDELRQRMDYLAADLEDMRRRRQVAEMRRRETFDRLMDVSNLSRDLYLDQLTRYHARPCVIRFA